MYRVRPITHAALATVLLAACGAHGDEPAAPPLSGRALEAVLEEPLDVDWPSRALEDVLTELATEHRLPLALGPEVTREGTVFGAMQGRPLERLLDDVARIHGARAVRVGEAVWVGRQRRAGEVAGSAEVFWDSLAGKELSDLRKYLMQPIDLAWEADQPLVPRLDEARGAVRLDAAAVAEKQMLTDGRLRGFRRGDVLLVLLGHVGATLAPVDPSAGTLLVTPLPEEPPTFERAVRVDKPNGSTLARSVAAKVDDVEATGRGRLVRLKGPWLAVRDAQWMLDPGKQPEQVASKLPTPPGEVYTLRAANVSVRRFAQEVEEISGRKVTIDKESLAAAGKGELDRLSCLANDLPLERLLELALKPAGMEAVVTKDTVLIRALDPENATP